MDFTALRRRMRMTATVASNLTGSLPPFDDIFRELQNDLETEINDWQWRHFYIHLEDDEMQDKDYNRPNTPHPLQEQQQPPSPLSVISNKRIKNDGDSLFFYQIPDYLSASLDHYIQTEFSPELRDPSNPIDFQDLQQLVLLKRRISILHLHQQLWHRFFQSGTGQIKQREQSSWEHPANLTLSLWPEAVTSVMISAGITANVPREEVRIEQATYVDFVRNYLFQVEQQIHRCRLRFDAIMHRLSIDTGALNSNIEDFLRYQNDLQAIRLHIQARMFLLESICLDRAYQLEYLQLKPTDPQLELIRRICYLTYEREQANQEMIEYKFNLPLKKYPKLVNLLNLPPPILITTLTDSIIRERLCDEYQKILQRTKSHLLQVCNLAVEAKKNDSEKKFDNDLLKIWKDQCALPLPEQLTRAMVALIKQRQDTIVECLKRIYHLKSEFRQKKPPPPTTTTIISC